ncbi:MAG: DUF4346 domain-containing protein [Candidatus Altiarchaeota archaeon]
MVAKDGIELEFDPNGFIVVDVDSEKKKVILRLYGYDRKLKGRLEGLDYEVLMRKVLNDEWVSRLDHAGYLGRELQKAEIAIKNNLKYVQDDPLGFDSLSRR